MVLKIFKVQFATLNNRREGQEIKHVSQTYFSEI